MNKEKQIEEMAKDFCALTTPCEECHLYKNGCHAKKYAVRAYKAGYRKASEVAREIIEEAEKIFMFTCSSLEAYTDWQKFKKKYTEDKV